MRINATKCVIVGAMLVLCGLPALFAQEKSAPEARPPEIPLKVQVVLTEFDGAKKISSLPYTLNMLGTGPHNGHPAQLRFGVKIPISTGSGQVTYQDVGTNIDGTAVLGENGQYRLDLLVDRSSVTMPNSGADWKPGQSYTSADPLVRSFRNNFTVILKDGQTVQGTYATDPVTGHVLKVDVTLNVLK
jgi:hypothetical protein